jgi:chromatin segregation and condensation protein Rec8/ScpA/Scc1 (kleisin family)
LLHGNFKRQFEEVGNTIQKDNKNEIHNQTTLVICASQKMIINDLTLQEIAELDLRITGKLIKDSAFMLSRKVNQELLEPMSKWLDDPNWMTRFKVYEGHTPNWAEYKRKEREWTQHQKDLFRQRIKMYWQEIHKRRKIKSEVAKLLNVNKKIIRRQFDTKPLDDRDKKLGSTFAILKMLSPSEKNKRQTLSEFMQAMKQSISNLLPWRLILISDINEMDKGEIAFNKMKTYFPEDPRKDKISKLIHLLEMETDGAIKISQSAPFGDIYVSKANINSNFNSKAKPKPTSAVDANSLQISKHISSPKKTDTYSSYFSNNSEIQIKDSEGCIYQFDWRNLSNAQRNKVITDIKQHKILCKVI